MKFIYEWNLISYYFLLQNIYYEPLLEEKNL